jgi:hypothetical protein
VKCDISRSHHTRFTGGVKCDATPKRNRWCHSLVGADHCVGSQRQYTRQAVSSERRERLRSEPLLAARLIAIAPPSLGTPKIGDISGTHTLKSLIRMVVSLALRIRKPMSVESEKRVMASAFDLQDGKKV